MGKCFKDVKKILAYFFLKQRQERGRKKIKRPHTLNTQTKKVNQNWYEKGEVCWYFFVTTTCKQHVLF